MWFGRLGLYYSYMTKAKPKTWVEISKASLKKNADLFRARIGRDVKLMGIVKANAYGHGLLETAKTLKTKVDRFGVDNLDEALALKKAKVGKPILTLGFTPSWRMTEAARAGISITIGSIEQLRAAARGAKRAKRTLCVHVKVETGTTRQGIELKELPDVSQIIVKEKFLVLEGLSTHFADIEDTENHAYAGRQLENYEQALKLLEVHGMVPEIRHTACTAAAMLYPETWFDMVRVGIGMYGIWPSHETKLSVVEHAINLPIEPVLTWKTRIAQVKNVKRGTPISYGRTEKMPRNGKLAVLGIGYWDGLDRGLSSLGEVIIKGVRCKIVGRVCMNMCMVDVTDVENVKAEDEVILIGRGGNERITAEEFAEKLNSIGYEVVARINPTTPRILK